MLAAGPVVAYESAVLPADREAAWAMLHAANGLHGDSSMTPWYLHAKYQAYDAYGHPAAAGTLEYVWAGKDQSRVTYAEPGMVWTQWQTEQARYAPAGQQELRYPERLIADVILDPFSAIDAPRAAPRYLVPEVLASIRSSCFRSKLPGPYDLDPATPSVRFCANEGRPILWLAQTEFDLYMTKPVAFEHRLVAQQQRLVDGGATVLEFEIDTLRSATGEELKTLTPPANALRLEDAAERPWVPQSLLHLLKRPAPLYPADAKRRKIQGAVRFEVRLGVDGKTTVLGLLHAPDPVLAGAAEDAVKQWTYEPYLQDGKPVEVTTMITVRFALR